MKLNVNNYMKLNILTNKKQIWSDFKNLFLLSLVFLAYQQWFPSLSLLGDLAWYWSFFPFYVCLTAATIARAFRSVFRLTKFLVEIFESE